MYSTRERVSRQRPEEENRPVDSARARGSPYQNIPGVSKYLGKWNVLQGSRRPFPGRSWKYVLNRTHLLSTLSLEGGSWTLWDSCLKTSQPSPKGTLCFSFSISSFNHFQHRCPLTFRGSYQKKTVIPKSLGGNIYIFTVCELGYLIPTNLFARPLLDAWLRSFFSFQLHTLQTR